MVKLCLLRITEFLTRESFFLLCMKTNSIHQRTSISNIRIPGDREIRYSNTDSDLLKNKVFYEMFF